ncbi:MAG: class I SAM-dependent methyltransferase [Desulfobacterales bacterium]|nr:MAG: class I SAM-dependent methyltransferase [Desulfobacterales bacterium]
MSANNRYHQLYNTAYYERLHRLNSIGNNAYREAQRLETIEVLCKPDVSDEVLELGCGTGFYTRLLAPRVHRIVGVDFSATAIEKAIAHGQADNVQFFIGDIQNLSMFPESSFDKILAIDILEHLSDFQLRAALREVVCLLREGGAFVFFTPCRTHWIESLKSKNIIIKQIREHIGVRSEAVYRQIMQEHGLEVKSVLRYETCIPILRTAERKLKRIPLIGNLFVSRLGMAVSN